ncbi:MAG: hypothetical protein JO325_03210 [Solirubrobacterales bacterium]|nr:hypothetical protein [Solirubrobacterales bacterium]
MRVGAKSSSAPAAGNSAGPTETVSLRNRGTATIKGRVIEWRSGAPVEGCSCFSGSGVHAGLPWRAGNTAVTDADGTFTLDGFPVSD